MTVIQRIYCIQKKLFHFYLFLLQNLRFTAHRSVWNKIHQHNFTTLLHYLTTFVQ